MTTNEILPCLKKGIRPPWLYPEEESYGNGYGKGFNDALLLASQKIREEILSVANEICLDNDDGFRSCLISTKGEGDCDVCRQLRGVLGR